MPSTHDHSGANVTTLTNSDEMAYYRLAVIKGRLKLEANGLRGRGGAMRPRMAAEFGLKPRDTFEAFIAVAERRMAALLEKKRAQAEVDTDRWAEHQAEEQDLFDRSNNYEG
jgi:hypothetical protein